jgi:hypothetical protein
VLVEALDGDEWSWGWRMVGVEVGSRGKAKPRQRDETLESSRELNEGALTIVLLYTLLRNDRLV